MEKVPESGHREAGRGNVQAFESGLQSLDHRNRAQQMTGGGAGSAVDKGSLIRPRQWECKLTSLTSEEMGTGLYKTKKPDIALSYNPDRVPLASVLLIIAQVWKQSRCPRTEGEYRKGDHYSHRKRWS